jgi:uncharacterized protein YbaP (TraB family)
MILSKLKQRLAIFGALAVTACAAPAAENRPASPAMWRVADADTTIYLFGTIHLLPADTKWRSPAFDQAALGADTLVVETDIDETNPAGMIGELFKLAVSPGLPPLAERVPADKRDDLNAMIAKAGVPAAALDKLETWAAAFLLLGAQFKDLGLNPGSGVESALKKEFVARKKPIGQLETNAEQLGFFDRLPEAAQRKFLEGVLDDPKDSKKEFATMLSAWTRGDVAGVAKSFNEGMHEAPELMDALLVQRNINWTTWLKKRLDEPGNVMVAVGAGHLAGDKSVVAMLEKQGVKVTRVQ